MKREPWCPPIVEMSTGSVGHLLAWELRRDQRDMVGTLGRSSWRSGTHRAYAANGWPHAVQMIGLSVSSSAPCWLRRRIVRGQAH